MLSLKIFPYCIVHEHCSEISYMIFYVTSSNLNQLFYLIHRLKCTYESIVDTVVFDKVNGWLMSYIVIMRVRNYDYLFLLLKLLQVHATTLKLLSSPEMHGIPVNDSFTGEYF